jgi:hypothetical protein
MLQYCPVIKMLKPKHNISEELRVLGEYMRREVTLLTDFSYYALPPQEGVMIYIGGFQLVAKSVSDTIAE